MTASSHGLGAVVAQALDHGCRDIIIGVGGSASTDGGAGFLTALGATVRDQYGARLDPSGTPIGNAAQLDLTALHPDIACASFTLAVDVDNPLYGPLGAASVYAPQKGASPDQVIELDRALRGWADVVERETKMDCRTAAGAGRCGRRRFRRARGVARSDAARHRRDHRPDRAGQASAGCVRGRDRRGLARSTVVARQGGGRGMSACQRSRRTDVRRRGRVGADSRRSRAPPVSPASTRSANWSRTLQRSMSHAAELLAVAAEQLARDLRRTDADAV